MNLDDKDYYRKRWNELRKQHPEMGKTQLRQVDKALFAWLYRNDREWLNQAYLDSVKETNHDFRLRRFRWAVKELEKEGEELQMWKIIRKAGIREEYKFELSKRDVE